ncbi:MAG: transposase, partial [Luteitalea sp.]
GAVLLKAADRRLGLIDGLAATLIDRRAAPRVHHSVRDLLAQRVYGIACGHADANDADTLADDPVHKLLLDRDPITGGRLASQPTLSRFENSVSARTLYRLGERLADTVITQHRRRRHRVRRVTIDLDLTEDPTHGAQAPAPSASRPRNRLRRCSFVSPVKHPRGGNGQTSAPDAVRHIFCPSRPSYFDQTYPGAAGRVCCLTARSQWPALRTNTNWYG